MIWEKISWKCLKTLPYVLSLDRKIEHKSVYCRLHTARIDESLHRQSREHSQNKDNTSIFHTDILPYFERESKEIKKPQEFLSGFQNNTLFYTVGAAVGLGPYLLSSGLLLVANSTISQIIHAIGISDTRIIQPLFPISWSLRAQIANPGIKIARLYTMPTILYVSPAIIETILITIPIRKFTRKKYQYSERVARPLNVAYFCNAKR